MEDPYGSLSSMKKFQSSAFIVASYAMASLGTGRKEGEKIGIERSMELGCGSHLQNVGWGQGGDGWVMVTGTEVIGMVRGG